MKDESHNSIALTEPIKGYFILKPFRRLENINNSLVTLGTGATVAFIPGEFGCDSISADIITHTEFIKI
ncbi:Hypothetical predicted protein [Octopus vulgaris]|uniref:Uncharacterized protein n=1 Tax=Octopus vulgaris TaxID=6645 RepID=A0AA36B5P9_OCTVU|nr:Hypothetical predicted protein [Octopus vulgaris]